MNDTAVIIISKCKLSRKHQSFYCRIFDPICHDYTRNYRNVRPEISRRCPPVHPSLLAITKPTATVSCYRCVFDAHKLSIHVSEGARLAALHDNERKGDATTVQVTRASTSQRMRLYSKIIWQTILEVPCKFKMLPQPTLSGAHSKEHCISQRRCSVVTDSSTCNIDNTYFLHNRARDEGGGAIWFESSHVSLSASTFFGNEGSAYGGAISGMYSDAGLIVTTSTFENNQDVRGGAIAVQYEAHALIFESVFKGNAAYQGAALYASDGARVTLERTSLASGKATEGAALYFTAESKLALRDDTNITSNVATSSGGGFVLTKKSSATIDHSTISKNIAQMAAGVEVSFGSALTLTNRSRIATNTETSLSHSRWWYNPSGLEARRFKSISGSRISVINGAMINENMPYNVACDADCSVSGLSFVKKCGSNMPRV